jgi:hypothetical protein
MTVSGSFAHVMLPPDRITRGTYPPPQLVPGAPGTAWLASSEKLTHFSAGANLRSFELPTMTAHINALVSGCDGTLYAAEDVPQIAHIGPQGRIEEYRIDARGINSLARTSDCRIWFLAGTNYPRQQIGTLELTAR